MVTGWLFHICHAGRGDIFARSNGVTVELDPKYLVDHSIPPAGMKKILPTLPWPLTREWSIVKSRRRPSHEFFLVKA